jgi:hypothetical protein
LDGVDIPFIDSNFSFLFSFSLSLSLSLLFSVSLLVFNVSLGIPVFKDVSLDEIESAIDGFDESESSEFFIRL